MQGGTRPPGKGRTKDVTAHLPATCVCLFLVVNLMYRLPKYHESHTHTISHFFALVSWSITQEQGPLSTTSLSLPSVSRTSVDNRLLRSLVGLSAWNASRSRGSRGLTCQCHSLVSLAFPKNSTSANQAESFHIVLITVCSIP